MREFTKNFIRDVVKEIWDENDYPDLELLELKDEGSCGRWCNLHTAIFSLEGKFYRTSWQVSASETSDGSGDFEDGFNKDYGSTLWSDVEEVQKVEKLVIVWEPV